MPPPTPNPSFSFDTGTGADRISIGGSPADANIAVSSTHICITARAAFACYAKNGTLVSPGPGFAAQPYTAQNFFAQSGIPIPNALDGNWPTKDGRVVFDPYRKRFFMAFQSRLSGPLRLLIAVSKSENPQDGWWTYGDPVETAEVNGQDYMYMGVNATHLLISNEMANCTGTLGTPSWMCAYVKTRHLMYTTEDLVAGKPYTRTEWSNANANGAVPCVHNSYTEDAFWVHRDDNAHLSVWVVRGGKVSSKRITIQSSVNPVNDLQKGGYPLSYSNIGRNPQNAQYRDGRIVFVSNDGHMWPGTFTPLNCVRLMRLNVSKFFDFPSFSTFGVTIERDRIFGRASAGDPPDSLFHYGWPAVAFNAKGDIVVGSIRANLTTYPELRASVWFDGEPDISSSVLLKASSQPLRQFHMAGACADPSSNAIYLAQQYGESPSWRIHVARMLG